MTNPVTLPDANQTVSRHTHAGEAGEAVAIARDGKSVAGLSPIGGQRRLTPEQQRALEDIKAIMDHGYALDPAPFDREAAHDRFARAPGEQYALDVPRER